MQPETGGPQHQREKESGSAEQEEECVGEPRALASDQVMYRIDIAPDGERLHCAGVGEARVG